jgi:hypothetical protein
MTQSSGVKARAENGRLMSPVVMPREGGASSTPRRLGPIGAGGILDRPVEPGDDSGMNWLFEIRI